MKRINIFLIVVALIVGMAGCDDTTQNLEIRTWYDLDAVRDNLAGNYTLMNDLDFTTSGYKSLASKTADGGRGWEPIIHSSGIGFMGTFDGQGYEIRDLYINRPEENLVGLFGCVEEEGFIKDIGLINITVIGNWGVGGLAGRNKGTLSDSYSTGSVTGNEQVGGLVGYIGHLWESNVSNSYSSSSVTGNKYIGGLVGEDYSGTVCNSYSTGSVTGVDYVGGLVGGNEYGTVSNSHATGSVTGDCDVGGLVGFNSVGDVYDSYSTGNVTGNWGVGGLVGVNWGIGDVHDSYSTGNVTGNAKVGGLVGYNGGGTVSDSFWDIETSGQTTSDGGTTGKNTTEMQYITTFSGAGWSIIAVALNETNPAYIWNIVNGVTYPFLSWQPIL